MLTRIFIQNFALIDSLEIALDRGLQVITGETGAGKSIILGALRLILGERADVKSLQNSESKSIAEAEFLVNENLFDQEYQFQMIDGLSKNKTLIFEYQKEFENYKNWSKNLDIFKNQLAEGNKENDYKAFLLTELNEVNLDEFDLEEVQNQLSKQENAEAIVENLSLIFNKMDQEEIGVLDSLLDVKTKLAKVAALSHEFSKISTRFEENFVEFKDLLFDLQNQAEDMETDPEVVFELSNQLNKINSLFLKHKVNSVEELQAIRDQIFAEQTGFADLEVKISKLETQISQKKIQLEKLATELSKNRKKAIPDFIKKIEKLLHQLGLEKAKIEVQLTDLESFTSRGKESIQLLFQANSGFPLRPIQTAISGGERSRVMLSIKKLMAENAELPTLILDEIDTGVSGKVAEEIGNVMKEMAENMQLIVISHLAQVAAKGNNNYKVIKREISGKTQSTIIRLNEEEKLQEIAQLLSGAQITEAAVSQARELMK